MTAFDQAWSLVKEDARERAKRILIERHGEEWYKKYKESMGREQVDPRRNLKPNPGDVPGKPWRMCIDCEKNSALSDSPYCHACQTIRWETDNPEYVGKADTGMWEEIYAPLHEQLAGRGSGQSSDRLPALDFLPTSVARDMLDDHITRYGGKGNEKEWRANIRRNKGDHGFNVDDLKQSILEEGFKIPENILASRSQYVLPNFRFDDFGRMAQHEGRHRTMALDELGAPYIPSFGVGTWNARGIEAPWEINPVYSRKDEDGRGPSQYSMAAYYGPDKGRYPVPPSFIFNQELVPGMGRLVPVVGGERISDEEMTTHLDNTPAPWWVSNPEWAITYDD